MDPDDDTPTPAEVLAWVREFEPEALRRAVAKSGRVQQVLRRRMQVTRAAVREANRIVRSEHVVRVRYGSGSVSRDAWQTGCMTAVGRAWEAVQRLFAVRLPSGMSRADAMILHQRLLELGCGVSGFHDAANGRDIDPDNWPADTSESELGFVVAILAVTDERALDLLALFACELFPEQQPGSARS